LPGAHASQLVVPSPKKPALHTQAALPTEELECAGHALQLDAPVSFWNVAGGHSAHVPSDSAPEAFPYLPAAQRVQ